MKKIIAAAAGLMMVGTMATAALADAGTTFKGNARVRYYYQDNYNLVDSKDTHWASRVRLEFKSEAKGGAYAVGRFRLADATWDGTQKTAKGGESTNLRVDKGYIGVPMGPIVVEGGMGYNTLPVFFRADAVSDFLRAKYTSDTTTVLGFFEKLDEYNDRTVVDPVTKLSSVVKESASEDDDIDLYGVHVIQKFGGAWTATGTLALADNQQLLDNQAPVADGFGADFSVVGAAGEIGIAAEFAYKDADLLGSDDDAMGGYAGVNVPFGAASVSATIGMTADGYVASGDFAADDTIYSPVIMLSNYSPIATGILIGSTAGDAYWFNVAPRFQATEQLSFMAEFTYENTDVDVIGAGPGLTTDIDVMEFGGKASYAVSDGAALHAYVAYLDIENAEENPMGVGVSLEISF